jgi:hypothetical protein
MSVFPLFPGRQVTSLLRSQTTRAWTEGVHRDSDHNHARAGQVGLSALTVPDTRGVERSTSFSRLCRHAQWEIKRDLQIHSSRPLFNEAGGMVAEKKEGVEPTVRKLCRMMEALTAFNSRLRGVPADAWARRAMPC